MGPMSFRMAALAGLLATSLTGCALLADDPARTAFGRLLPGGPLPQEASGVDLGPLTPGEPVTFCEAVARAPLRWTTDALVPMQFWVRSFESATDIPEQAAPAVDRLLAFTRARLQWSLGGRDDRPMWDAGLDEAAITLSDVAIDSCPDLPLSVGPVGISDTPLGWRELDEDAVAARCASIGARLERDVDEFVAAYGRAPRHQIEMESMLSVFVASDFHGLAPGADGAAIVVPVPGGACDGG